MWPDVAGPGLANHTAMLLSAAIMFEWLGHWYGSQHCLDEVDFLPCDLEKAFSVVRILPFEFCGKSVTDQT